MLQIIFDYSFTMLYLVGISNTSLNPKTFLNGIKFKKKLH